MSFKVGDYVVAKSNEYLNHIHEVVWINGDKMRLRNQDFNHVFVVDCFRKSTQKEIERGFRDE